MCGIWGDQHFALKVIPEQPMLLRAPSHCKDTVAAPQCSSFKVESFKDKKWGLRGVTSLTFAVICSHQQTHPSSLDLCAPS